MSERHFRRLRDAFAAHWGGKDHRSLANAAHRETEKSEADI
jgi:hypothetical protein